MVYSVKNKSVLFLTVFLMMLLVVPFTSWASTDIKISVTNPEKNGEVNYEGTTVNKVLGTPTVFFGENRVLGTLRITGKEGVATPIRPGNKVMVSLPMGLSYMKVPNADNYKNYVEWPEEVDGFKNQITDGSSIPAVRFIAGTPHSITVEVSNIDQNGKTVVLDFVFNKENFSTVRVTKLIEVAEEYKSHPDQGVTRIEFVKMLADVTVPFPSLNKLNNTDEPIADKFSDLPELPAKDEKKIDKLIKSGIVAGYPGGLFKPNQMISRVEVASMLGRLFPDYNKTTVFKDDIPVWAVENINAAAAHGFLVGYPDGTFRANNVITKSEAIDVLQRVLGFYCQ